MIWFNPWGSEEKIFLIGFLLAYAIYVGRVWVLSRRYRLSVGNVFKKIIIRSLYFTLILAAILGPSFGDVKKETAIVGKDIYLVMDVSLSMNANDVAPSRLEVAKKCAQEIVKKASPNDRIGLIIFASEAYNLCPLTYDHVALETYLKSVHIHNGKESGSDINQVWALLKAKNANGRKLDKEKKIVVVLSDGEFVEPTAADELATIAKKYTCFGLAFGTLQGAPILYSGKYKMDKKGETVISKVKLSYLSDIAVATGGYARIATDAQLAAERFVYDTNRLNQYFKGYKKRDVSSNKFYYILMIAMVLIIIDGLTTLKIIHL